MRWAIIIETHVIYGIGRAVRAVRRMDAEMHAITGQAEEIYAASAYLQRHIPREIFIPGMISALLVRDAYPSQTMPLSAAALMDIFSQGDTERHALAIYNATLTSPLAQDDTDTIATELMRLWNQHHLLQDRATAQTLTVQQTLPGALLHLLGSRRPLLSTWLREDRLESAYRQGRRA